MNLKKYGSNQDPPLLGCGLEYEVALYVINAEAGIILKFFLI